MNASPRRRTPRWLVALLAVCLVTAGAAASVVAMRALPGMAILGMESGGSNTQIVNSVTREEQVVLLSLGIQGISTKNANATFMGQKVPGTERATFLQYSFNAKIGIDGKDVKIEQTGDKEYLVSIPRFIFLGHSNEAFRVAAEGNGVLSWATPEIDTVEMINNILNDEAQAQYITANQETLKEQATAFYAGIIAAVDPTVTVRVVFDD